MRQAKSFQRRAWAGFDDHTLRTFQRDEWPHGRAGLRRQRQHHVTHAVKGLIDDPVVIAVERRLGFRIGATADVHRVAERAGLGHAPQGRTRSRRRANFAPHAVVRASPWFASNSSIGRPNGKSIPHSAEVDAPIIETKWANAGSRSAVPATTSRFRTDLILSRPSGNGSASLIQMFRPASFRAAEVDAEDVSGLERVHDCNAPICWSTGERECLMPACDWKRSPKGHRLRISHLAC